MFLKRNSDEKSGLEKTIDDLFNQMATLTGDDPQYGAMADQMVKLYKLKEVDSKRRVSADVLATIVANLVGIAMIVGHERTHVVTSKALTLIQKIHS